MRRVDRRTNALPNRPTDRPTDQPTDTASYRGVLSHLKTKKKMEFLMMISSVKKKVDNDERSIMIDGALPFFQLFVVLLLVLCYTLLCENKSYKRTYLQI